MKATADRIRRQSLISIYHVESGHPGGILSSIDLIAYLFTKEMVFDKNDFNRIDRDRFILSKGHCAPALYAVAVEVGIIARSRLKGLRKLNHELQGHTHRGTTPWVEASTGSIGQGFSFAIGEAKGLKIQNIDNRVFVMLGDGELQKGEVWEGTIFAGHHKIDKVALCNVFVSSQKNNKEVGFTVDPTNISGLIDWNVYFG